MTNTTISRRTLEKALPYLACRRDGSAMELDIKNLDRLREGAVRCTTCPEEYLIKDGVLYTFEKGNGYEWGRRIDKGELATEIASTLEDSDLTWAKIISLPAALTYQRKGVKDREAAIGTIFGIVKEVITMTNPDNDTKAYLMQAATAARYDLEVYKGTFMTPADIMTYLKQNYSRDSGIILEGACATGENLQELAGSLESEVCIGLDISGQLIRQALGQNQRDNVLLMQGAITSLPIKNGAVGLYEANNVWDRVGNPREAALEIMRVTNPVQSLAVISNCTPLQFADPQNPSIIYVSAGNQLGLGEIVSLAGFSPRQLASGKGEQGWRISTLADKDEILDYESIAAARNSLGSWVIR